MIESYITCPTAFPIEATEPWAIVGKVEEIVARLIGSLSDEYTVKAGVAIHRTAVIGHNVTIKAPASVSCFSCSSRQPRWP